MQRIQCVFVNIAGTLVKEKKKFPKLNIMQKIKSIFVDIDGTLLKEGSYFPNTISEANIEALKDYASAGGKIVLSTGRDINETIKVAEYLVSKNIPATSIPYLICLNGSVIVEFSGKNPVVQARYFELESCKNLINYLIRRRYNFFLSNNKNELFFTNKLFSRFIFWLLFKERYEKNFFSDQVDLSKVQKIMIFLKLPRVWCVRRRLKYRFEDDFYFSSGPHFFIEIIDKKVNKWYAAQEVARLLNIETENVAAMGNEGNDIMSLEGAGFGAGVDLKYKKHLVWDSEKINYHTTNRTSEAVANVINKLKREGAY